MLKWGVFAMGAGGIVLCSHETQAQPVGGYLMQTYPYPVYSPATPASYNIKLGKMIARFHAGVQTEFNDNINLSQNAPEADISIAPNIGVGFIYPLSTDHILQLDVSAAYRWYLNNGSINSFAISPTFPSRLDYRVMTSAGQINVHDTFAIQVDPISRPEISGGPTRLMNFQRFVNTIGISGEWRPIKRWGMMGGYDYTIDVSLNNQFSNLDHQMHTFSVGTFYELTSRTTVGVNGTYSTWSYNNKIQNDGGAFTIGPFIVYRLSKFITFEASAGYSVSFFDTSGTIGDLSNYGGLGYSASVRHTINSRMSHGLRGSRSFGLGFGSNFTESWALQYNHSWRLSSPITLNTTLSYDTYASSGAGADSGSRYMLYLSTAYHLSRRWSTALSYAFAHKDSDLVGQDYTQNRITIDLRREF
jgi:hypothetical protein